MPMSERIIVDGDNGSLASILYIHVDVLNFYLFEMIINNMRNCYLLGDFEKEVLIVTDVLHKFLVEDISSEIPSDSK